MLNARVNIKDYDGWSALMFAASKGHWHIVEYLVQAWSVRTPPLAEPWARRGRVGERDFLRCAR